MGDPITITYVITSMTPKIPAAGNYTVTIAYTLSCAAVPTFTSTVSTAIQSSVLYEGITSSMTDLMKAAAIKLAFEMIEKPAFESYATQAKAARNENALIAGLAGLTGGVSTMSSSVEAKK